MDLKYFKSNSKLGDFNVKIKYKILAIIVTIIIIKNKYWYSLQFQSL